MRRRNHKQTIDRNDIDDNYYVDHRAKDIISYWSLMILLKLHGHREFIDKNGDLDDEDLAYFLHLDDYAEDKVTYERKDVLATLNKQFQKLEQKEVFTTPFILEKNLKKLQEMLQLSEVELDLLTFVIYIYYYDVLESAGDTLSRSLPTDKLEHVLAILLDRSRGEIKAVLSSHSKLSSAGLIRLRPDNNEIKYKLDVLSEEFVDKMMNFEGDIEDMIKDVVRKCAPAELSITDFKHLDASLDLLIPYLNHTIACQKKGVNILLYGQPGTGKTELTKAIAAELGKEIYEISYANENDDAIEGSQRLKAYRVAQSFFAQREMLLMFDEVEDVFSNDDDFSIFGNKRQKNKAWINRILESNAIATIWITNDVNAIDNALVRRFDMSIEVPIPPKKKRQEIIKNYSQGFLSEAGIKKIAQDAHIAPALITRAAKVVESVKETTEDTSKAFEQIINSTLKAQGHRGIEESDALELPESYALSLINTAVDLEKIVEGIRERPSARLCFYGVPGTGKSAFGKYLSEQLERPFLLKKGSDLISMWVGETEKNIASAFKEAKEEGAVLVFDEVDSFLQDRRSSQQSWEVTQVNEMLVQMENFEGIFIATTNLMEGLDQASLRRFDLKLEFGYLKKSQAEKLFLEEIRLLKLAVPTTKVQEQLQQLNNLAPGDFATVRRQHRFRPIIDAADFLERLKEECALKEQHSNHVMGFLAS